MVQPYTRRLVDVQYPKMITIATIQCAWAIQTEQPGCSLRFCLFHTGQTAVASIPRLSLSGLHGMSLCACAVRVCSRLSASYAGLLPVSSLHGSDPAWPARLLTRASKVCEHLRGQIHPRSIVNYSYSTTEKRKWRTLQWMRAIAIV
jgi:hypothetical protein